MLALFAVVAAGTVYAAADELRNAAVQTSTNSAPFLRLFTVTPENFPSFFTLIGFLLPLLGIALGFDSVSSERSQATLPRLLSQPIHRDSVINGKFAAGLGVIAVVLSSVVLVIAGVGLFRLGIVPSVEEVLRIVVWLIVTTIYVGFWLAFATLCSVALRRAATAALVAIAVWLLFALFGDLFANLLADAIRPVSASPTVDEVLRNARLEDTLSRISPATLYEDATRVLLTPELRTLSSVLLTSQVDRAIPSSLSLDQSMLLALPQTIGLIALSAVSFAVAYVVFMRQEIRA
jgi:ABC-2 type transport system permease protein